MEIAYFNGVYMPAEEVKISPDDRGFLFGDGIYEVVKWYSGFFFDLEGHMTRLLRSMKETRIMWDNVDQFPSLAEGLIHRNNLGDTCALVYLQVTRGAAPRSHAFPGAEVPSTVYAFARRQSIDTMIWEKGISVGLTPDPRWKRCDLKTIALLPNILALQEALEAGFGEVCFVRDGLVTEAAHSNVFFVKDETVYTHPESGCILSGITRKNVISLAAANKIQVIEEAIAEDMLPYIHEAFITNTSGEVIPVTRIGDMEISEGRPGPVTMSIQRLFRELVINNSRKS